MFGMNFIRMTPLSWDYTSGLISLNTDLSIVTCRLSKSTRLWLLKEGRKTAMWDSHHCMHMSEWLVRLAQDPIA